MKYKYNFLKPNGEIVSTNNLNTIKKGLNWNVLNNYHDGIYTKECKAFFKQYNIYASVWNVAVFYHLDMVYLNETMLKELKKEAT